tara:strand:- start:483 stop:608 length:126 start_codon:yes stop_codon:yes gene_type:complete
MTREEFFEWLNTCPSNEWETPYEDFGHISVDFKIDEEKDDE